MSCHEKSLLASSIRITSRLAILLLFVGAGMRTLFSQEEDFARATVSDVRQFIDFEIPGGRISDDGWGAANKRFFLDTRGFKPEPPPKERNIEIVSDLFYVRLENCERNTDATVEVSFDRCYGRLNPQLHFEYPDSGIPGGVPVRVVCSVEFDMKASRIVKAHIGPTADTIMLSRAAAIKYVTEKRDHTDDPTVRKNADSTLAILRKQKQTL